ncbi:hypothetical protein BN2497_14417 [Janthinobacterium sp. CG23_2]|nr:hypothetical protein BN2497_14417 [Janthinobacterium sp. CG23_2]CUU33606.1 hypothetical protein BN3177_14417 [Janthinobacterium sp. CG23_2]
MCETKHESVTSLIEERIREEVIRAEKEALEPLRLAIEAELKKLGIDPRFTSMPTFMRDMRCTHIQNKVKRRINALVDQLVAGKRIETPSQQAIMGAPAGNRGVSQLVARKGELQDRIRTVVAAEAKAFFEETGAYITSLDVQFVRQSSLGDLERHVVDSVDAGITLS